MALLRWQPPHESAKNSLWDHLLSRVRPRYDPLARRDKGLSGRRAEVVAAKQTWADGIDAKGRPLVRPGTEPSEEGTLVWPSLQGATNWFSPSYSPKTGLFYVPVREMSAYYYKGEAEYEAGSYYTGGGERALRGDQASGAVRALDASTGEQRWEWKLLTPPWSGVMSRITFMN